MKPIGNVRGDINLQIIYSDVLVHQSLTPREPVEGTPPYLYFDYIEILCFWRPQMLKNGISAPPQTHLSCMIFLEKIDETSLYRFSEEKFWQSKACTHGSLSKLSYTYSYFVFS